MTIAWHGADHEVVPTQPTHSILPGAQQTEGDTRTTTHTTAHMHTCRRVSSQRGRCKSLVVTMCQERRNESDKEESAGITNEE